MGTAIYIAALFVGMFFLNKWINQRNIKMMRKKSAEIIKRIEQIINFEIPEEYLKFKQCCDHIVSEGFPYIAVEKDESSTTFMDDLEDIKNNWKPLSLEVGSSGKLYRKCIVENDELISLEIRCMRLLGDIKYRPEELLSRLEDQKQGALICDKVEEILSEISRYVDEFVEKDIWTVDVTVSHDDWVQLRSQWDLFCEELKSIENLQWWTYGKELNHFYSWANEMRQEIIEEREMLTQSQGDVQ